jgi:NADH-quinone oxidoreductase subunit E
MNDIKNLNNIIDLVEKNIKNSGLRLTKSRKDILIQLLKGQSEFTVDELFVAVHRNNSKTGIATIYRTVALLEKIGFLIKIYDSQTKSFRYKFSTDLKSINYKPLRSQESKKESVKVDLNKKPPDISSNNTTEISDDLEKINKVQIQLNEWISNLNKMKREKEFELEDMIKDFGKVDKVIELRHYDKSSLIQMLIDFQSEFNWLPKHILFYISTKLNIPLTNIYSVASFYKFFNLEPKGKYSIIVCDGTACHVRGSVNLIQRIINILNIKPGDTTSDYKFTLDTVNCLGCCALGPVMVLDNKYYSNPPAKALEKLFKGLD